MRERDERARSRTSLISERSGFRSPRSSISMGRRSYVPSWNIRSPMSIAESSDPKTSDVSAASSHANRANGTAAALQQTATGEYLYKYTRGAFGRGYSLKRHKRFFWVHPHTKLLSWSSANPSVSTVSQPRVKQGAHHRLQLALRIVNSLHHPRSSYQRGQIHSGSKFQSIRSISV